jgi:hypothetical protein
MRGPVSPGLIFSRFQAPAYDFGQRVSPTLISAAIKISTKVTIIQFWNGMPISVT